MSQVGGAGKNLVIGYRPFNSIGNEYTNNLKSILSQYGDVVPAPGLKAFLRLKSIHRYDVIFSSWSDNNFVGSSGGLSLYGVLREILLTLLLKALARRMIFVRHNVFPHKTRPQSSRIMSRLVDFYELLFDAVWVHSGHLQSAKREYIPHPLYHRREGAVVLQEDESFSGCYVIFGRISPYKKIERLLERLPADRKVLVCGLCDDEIYLEKLKSYAANNVIIRPGFMPEDQASSIVMSARALIITHADADMIVSGSIIYGLSFGTPVIAVSSPFVQWFNKNINSRSIFELKDFSDMATSFREFDEWRTAYDISGVAMHFSDDAISTLVKACFSRLGLL